MTANSATSLESFRSALDSLRRDVRRLSPMYRERLFEFANEFVVNSALHSEVLTLLYELNSANLVEQRVLIPRVEALLDSISNAYNPEETAAFREGLQRRSQLSEETYRTNVFTVFSCKGLLKSFKHGFTLGPIDFSLNRGEIAGVVGENGNGKTTFFRLVARELIQDQGTVRFPFLTASVESASWQSIVENVAYIPQELEPWYGGLAATLEFEAAVHGIRGQENLRRVAYIIERLRLAPHINKSWSQLSGGYRFRFALAKGMVWKPKLLILDEPLANLDPKAQLTLLKDLQDLARSVSHPTAVLMSSQHVYEVESVADRILYLENGRPRYNGKTIDLGLNRDSNMYLLNAEIDQGSLSQLFAPAQRVSIYHDGLQYVLISDVAMGEVGILKPLCDKGIKIKSFHNISTSTRRMFQEGFHP